MAPVPGQICVWRDGECMNSDSRILQSHLLLIDDQQANLVLLQHILARHGFERVTTESNPQKAIERFEELAPDLVITDLHMPDLDGFELTRRIKQRLPQTGFVPIVILTADTNPEVERHALSSGALDFLSKPLREAEVVLRVRNLLHTRLMHLELTERSEKFEHLALHDQLTSLPNRRLVHDRLQQAIAYSDRSGVPIGVMLIDLDEFKSINDNLGHDAGDQLLRQVGERLTSSLRSSDTVGRWGGDEFVVVLSHLRDGADTGHVANKLLAVMQTGFELGTEKVQINLSSGIATYPDDAATAIELIKHADAALYRVKTAGRSQS